MKTRYDVKASEPNIRDGDRVWLYWLTLTDPSSKLKLANVYHGPYIIVPYHTNSTVWLKHVHCYREIRNQARHSTQAKKRPGQKECRI